MKIMFIILAVISISICSNPIYAEVKLGVGSYQLVIGDGESYPEVYRINTVNGQVWMLHRSIGKNYMGYEWTYIQEGGFYPKVDEVKKLDEKAQKKEIIEEGKKTEKKKIKYLPSHLQ